MNARRLITALIIITLGYFYFRFFGIRHYSWAHYIFAGFIMGSLIIAFITKKRDITMGILYGLISLLFSLLIFFFFFSSNMLS